MASAVAAWSIASAASRICWVACFGAADHRAELAIDLGHFVAVEALAVQHRDFALGAVDGVVDQVELDLQLLALFDLGAVGFEHAPGLLLFRG